MYLYQVCFENSEWKYRLAHHTSTGVQFDWFSQTEFERYLFQVYLQSPTTFQLLHHQTRPNLELALEALRLNYIEIVELDHPQERFGLYYHAVKLFKGRWQERRQKGEYLKSYATSEEAVKEAQRITPFSIMANSIDIC